MSATIASGIVRDIPRVATNGVVQTTHSALRRKKQVTGTVGNTEVKRMYGWWVNSSFVPKVI